jgi:hypothetical protein
MHANRRKATWFNIQKLVVNDYALGILVINHRCNMFKETCLVDPRRTTGTPRRLGLEDPRTTVPTQRFLP